MKQTVRSFSIGLFAAGVILLLVFYFFAPLANETEGLDTEQMIAQITDEGYRVITEEEYISLSVKKENEEQTEAANTETESTETEQESEPEEEDNVDEASTNEAEEPNREEEQDTESGETSDQNSVNYTLTIEPGMASSEIGDTLADNQIIDNSSEFTDYLEENDYSLSVQIGEHELTSDMSFYEIAEAIAN